MKHAFACAAFLAASLTSCLVASVASAQDAGEEPIIKKKRRTVDIDPRDDKGGVRIHIKSDEPAGLYEETSVPSADNIGKKICTSPCDKEVPGGGGKSYVIASEDFPTSPSFQIKQKYGDVTIDVSPGSDGVRTAGWVFTTIGVVGVAVGVITLLVGVNEEDDIATEEVEDNSNKLIAGGAILGIGAGTLTIGIIMLVAGRTGIELRSGGEVIEDAKAGEPFAIDSRPRAIAPRYWLGEF